MIFPRLFKDNLSPWKTILLYGYQGTGKSLLVQAAATELQKLKGNYFSITFDDKFLNLNSYIIFFEDLIDLAIHKKPAIIFIDNITNFIDSRGEYKGRLFNFFNQIEKMKG